MELLWLNKLKQLVEKKPIVVLRIDEEEWEALSESRRGVSEFTLVRSQWLLEGVTTPTTCLIQTTDDAGAEKLFFGLISSKNKVATLDSRIKIRRVVRIRPQAKAELLRLVTEEPHATNLEAKLRGSGPIIALTPKLSSHLVERLASIDANHGAMRAVEESLSAPKSFRDAGAVQEDAVRTALKVFGLTADDQAQSLELVAGRETALARVGIIEDSVIEHDARYLPGYDLVESDLTGRAVFQRDDERLEVFTANRRPLEHVFGVDLIYLNVSRQNIVMLQYKMLEASREQGADTDWVYRPDEQMDEEIRRMRLFAVDHLPGPHEYRLNPAVFYLKFVKRDGRLRNGSIITPIDHFEKLREDPACRGPKNGLRISYESLSGRYLRQGAFIDLVRSGYIGAHAVTTEHLKVLVEAVLKSDRSVVAAIQNRIETGSNDDYDDDDFGHSHDASLRIIQEEHMRGETS